MLNIEEEVVKVDCANEEFHNDINGLNINNNNFLVQDEDKDYVSCPFMDSRKTNIEPLRRYELKQIFNSVSTYNQCKKEVKFTIACIIINVQKLSMSRENTESNLIDLTDEEINSPKIILNLVKKRIQQYESLFKLKSAALQ